MAKTKEVESAFPKEGEASNVKETKELLESMKKSEKKIDKATLKAHAQSVEDENEKVRKFLESRDDAAFGNMPKK